MKADIKAKQEAEVLTKAVPFSAEDKKREKKECLKKPEEFALPAWMLDSAFRTGMTLVGLWIRLCS